MGIPIRNPNNDGVVGRWIALAAISLAAMAVCGWVAGTSLGLFFGGLFAVTFLVPVGILAHSNLRHLIAGFAAVVAPVAIAWLMPALKGADTFAQCALASLTLAAYALAVDGISLVLSRLGLPAVFAAAVAIGIGIAWLTWPIWLSIPLVKNGWSGIVQDLVAVHPPLVINGILTNEPAWTERSLAYHLTNLNQDVPIQLPSGAGPCIALHGIVGMALASAAMVPRRKAPEAREQAPAF